MTCKVHRTTGIIKMIIWIVTVFLYQTGRVQALRFNQCNSGWVQVEEGTKDVILLTCTTSNLSDDIYWSISGTDQQSRRRLSTCLANQACSTASSIEYKLTRPDKSYSNLELLVPADRSFLAGQSFICSHSVSGGTEVVCNIDLVYPAQVSCGVQVVHSEFKWLINGSCIVTKVFSSRGLYTCSFMQRQNNSADVNIANGIYNPIFSAPDPLYGTGICSYTTEFPLVSAAYVYSFIVVPGNNSTRAGIITVERPVMPTAVCETNNIPENSTVACICQTISVGKPEGRLLWLLNSTDSINKVINVGSNGAVNLTMESQRLTRKNSGLVFQCVLDWATNFTGVQHKTNVNYGPDSVSIPENTTFYTDMTGSLQLNLTCQATGVKPPSGLIFSWIGSCLQTLQNSCTIQPRPPTNHGITYIAQEVKCSVRNPYNNNVSREAIYALDLKFPPSEVPRVKGYPDDGIIYANDTLNLTCIINGGNPSVTNTGMTCSGHNQTQTKGMSTSLSFLVREDINSTTCTCTGQWVISSYYTLNNSRQLIVSYPPSVPYISLNKSTDFPYIEGETAYFECDIIRYWGNPPAELIWSDQRESRSRTSRLPALLELKSLSWKDNNRNVSCRAKNNYTEAKNLVIRNFTVLQVYYRPIISFRTGNDNHCMFSLDPSQCSIDKGLSLEISCFAHSNPSPANITWRLANISGLIISSSANLTIMGSNIAQNITYICIVTTESSHSNDSRLPLSSLKELTVWIKAEEMTYVGEIVGGTVGGLAFIGLTAVIAFFLIKRRQETGERSTLPSDKSVMMDLRTQHKDDDPDSSPNIKSIDNYLTTVHPSNADQSLHAKSVSKSSNKDVDNRTPISPSPTSAEENNVYAKVNKATKHETSLNTAACLSSDSSGLKLQKKKKEKERGKEKKKKKKAENKKIIHQNEPLSMKPHREFIYENVEIASPPDSENKQKMCIGSDQGLTYTTVQFSETQLNEGRKTPPKQDLTTYASIDFSSQKV